MSKENAVKDAIVGLQQTCWELNMVNVRKIIQATIESMLPVSESLTMDVMMGSFDGGDFYPLTAVQDIPEINTSLMPMLEDGREDLVAHLPLQGNEFLGWGWDDETGMMVLDLRLDDKDHHVLIPPDAIAVFYDTATVKEDTNELAWGIPMLSPMDIQSRSVISESGQFMGYICRWSGGARVAPVPSETEIDMVELDSVEELDAVIEQMEGVEHAPYEPDAADQALVMPSHKTLQ